LTDGKGRTVDFRHSVINPYLKHRQQEIYAHEGDLDEIRPQLMNILRAISVRSF
jgi:ATP-dependent Clp protease ATP-binding subunit ClpC